MAATVEVIIEGKDSFSGTLGNFGSIITGIESAVRLAGDAFRAFSGFAMEGLVAVASYERLTLALTTLNAAQLLNAGVAKDMASAMELSGVMAEHLVDWMQELAIHSPFTLEEVANAFRLAQAYGFTAEEAQRLTQALIDFSAGTGATGYNMEAIARAMGQISTAGKLLGGDMLQLTSAGLPVAQILADAFGVSTAEIIKMREQGLLPAKEVIEALTAYMETNFQGAADAFSTSWAGLLSTFSDLKQMGLRELFTGMFDALHPLVIEIVEFMQGAGMDLAGALGDLVGKFIENNAVIQIATDFLKLFNQHTAEGAGFLSALGQSFQDIGENSDWVSSLNTDLDDLGGALLMLQFHISSGMPAWDAFKLMLEGLAEGDGPLAKIATGIQEFIATGETEGWDVAIGNLFKGVFDNLTSQLDFSGIVQNLLDTLQTQVSSTNWTPLGKTIGDVLSGAILIALQGLDILINQVDWRPVGVAISGALGEIWDGMFSSEAGAELDRKLNNFMATELNKAIPGILASVISGFSLGLVEGWGVVNLGLWVHDHIIKPIKEALGISSPSSIFKEIGINIILGLMSGFLGMITPLIAIINAVVQAILAPFAPILKLLGIDVSSLAIPMPTMPILPGTTTGGTGTTTGGGQVVNQYFSGATINVGSWDEIAYDCIYPNPFVGATSGQLGTGGTTGGGPTRGR